MKNTTIKNIGILTSGGDAPGLNTAIRSLCLTAKKRFNANLIGFKDGYIGLENNEYVNMMDLDLDKMVNLGGTILGTSREKPFKNQTINPKTKLSALDSIKETFKKNKLDVLVCLGGNGTNSTASLLSKEGLPVIGLPKTIDNDIWGTDESFGFHSAIDVAVDGIEAIRTTARSHHRVMVVEIMGHKAGWLGLYSGVATNADVILLPEIPYDIKKIGTFLKNRKANGHEYSIVVCAEGALSVEESQLPKKEFKKSRLEMTQSISFRVAKEIEAETGIETRTSVLGYLQRGGEPSAYDILLATQLGNATVDFIENKEFGVLVAVKEGKITGYPLEEVEGKVKNIPTNEMMLQTAKDLGIYFGE